MPYLTIEGEVPDNLNAYDTYQVYNCLDSCITSQLLPVMKGELNSNTATTYRREMNVLALCLEMSSKGFPVDAMCLASLLYDLQRDAEKALRILHAFCAAVGFRPVNPRSPIDVPALFYEHLALPPIYEFDRKTNKRKLSADIKALEKLRGNYPIAMPFVNAIVAYREASKMASVFQRGLEPGTGNLRCNYSPSGTETGRLSSQSNPYGRGTNGQNLTDRIRQVVAAPPGFVLLNFDLKTAESFAVAYRVAALTGDDAYLRACQSGDLHTAVCRLVWRLLAWSGDLKSDRAIAEQPFYRHFSYRDQAKRGGHGSNYYGTPRTIAGIINVPVKFVEDFQADYFGAFPGISDWHVDCIARVQRDAKITTALKRERRFWGRADDAATWREAIAYEPQSLVGDVMNEGLIQAQQWALKHMPLRSPMLADLRSQIHDAGLFLVPRKELDHVAAELTEALKYPVDFGAAGVMVLDNDISVGKRWNKAKPGKSKGFMAQGQLDWHPGQPLHWED